MAARFGSVPVRNSGTLCGNLGNGSPIGDSMPVLIALGATVVLRRGAQERTLPLEALYKDYRVTALERGEFIRAVRIPLPGDQHVATYKVSKRIEQDISAVCGGFAVRLAGERVAEARIAFGGMAGIPKRARHAEAAMTGKPWSLETLVAAEAALAQDFQPLSDFRATAAYRLQVAQALLRRFFLEHGGAPDAAALRIETVQPA
jgi:xanthine dehydrogenase small subunit